VSDYRLSGQADKDLDDISAYIAEDNASAAKRVSTAIIRTLQFLAKHPQSGMVRDDLRSGLRAFPARRPAHNYVILYYVNEDQDCIDVSDIIHGARDWGGLVARGDRGWF
jgi:plasmid stabilization system protein ParE